MVCTYQCNAWMGTGTGVVLFSCLLAATYLNVHLSLFHIYAIRINAVLREEELGFRGLPGEPCMCCVHVDEKC